MRLLARIGGLPVVLLSLTCAAGAARAAPEDPPTVDEIVAKVDAVLFHADRQDGLAGYTADVRELNGAAMQGGGDVQPSVRARGKLVVDAAARTQTFTLSSGKTRDLGAFAPSCGPWTLTSVMRAEVGLFSVPLAEQFPEATYERFIAKRGGGHSLRFKPRSAAGTAEPLSPVVTSIEIHVDGDGVPTDGTLGLDMQITKETAKLEFAFDEVDGKRRIASIANTISMANLTVRPKLTFAFVEVERLVLPRTVTVEVSAGDLSPSLARMMSGMTTVLELDGHTVKHTMPPVPERWEDVSAFSLRLRLGAAFPGDGIAAVLPAPAAPPKERTIGGQRHVMYLPHGLRLTFDGQDALVEVRLQLQAGNGFQPFVGTLSDGLGAGSTRADVEAAYGEPAAADSSTKTTTVTYPARGLEVVYAGRSAGPEAGLVAVVLKAPASE